MLSLFLIVAALGALALTCPRFLDGDGVFQLPKNAYGSDGVPLEFVHWPLYSSVAIDNAAVVPRSLDFFNYSVGQTVTGTGGGATASTLFHTNMLLANALPRPKTFTCVGCRIFVLPLDYTGGNPALADDTIGVALENNDQVDDITLLLQCSWFQLRQGEIEEIAVPAFLLPSMTGIGGIAATSISNTNAASIFQSRIAVHSTGVGYTIRKRPFVLWNQQFFTARLLNEWTTNPTTADDKLVVCVLDGILGRELQG